MRPCYAPFNSSSGEVQAGPGEHLLDAGRVASRGRRTSRHRPRLPSIEDMPWRILMGKQGVRLGLDPARYCPKVPSGLT